MLTGIDAGPAKVSCSGSIVTLQAFVSEAPANFEVQWDDADGPGYFLVVAPLVTTDYRVVLTDLESMETYEDWATVLVHPDDPDLSADGAITGEDWGLLFAAWDMPAPNLNYDPDGDGRVSILDWFYFCNFDLYPPNTPPRLSVEIGITRAEQSEQIAYSLEDDEQQAQLLIAAQPANGFAFLAAGALWYDPQPGFSGTDTFEVTATDGYITLPAETVTVFVLPQDTWMDLYNDIFFVRCKACHIDAVSGGLSLAGYSAAQTGGNSGAGFIAGSPELSPIYLRVADGSMPIGQTPLSFLEIERIRTWILAGAQQ